MVRRRRSSPAPVGLRALQGRLNADGSITTVSGTLTDQSTQVNVLDPNTGQTIATSPVRSASRAPGGNVLLRSYEGVEIAATLLMLDLIDRNPTAFNSQDNSDGNGFSYDRTDYALLLRRDAGTTVTSVPAITSAQLLCTAPGFVPARNDPPEDLSTASSLATLIAATTLSPGGNVHVK